MISMRGGSGLGDAIYVQSVARHLVGLGADLEIRTNYPEVFRPLKNKIVTIPFKRERVDRLAHYSNRRAAVGTDQFIDCCIEAGLKGEIEFKLDWGPNNLDLVARLRSAPRPVVVVQMPRAPFARTDGFGIEFLPDCSTIQRAIDKIKDRVFLVQIGAGQSLYNFNGIDLDLTNQTTVSDLIDIGYVADGFLGYCSFIIPLAETFCKPALLIWSRRGLNSHSDLIRKITPRKVLHRPSSRYVIDDCRVFELEVAVNALCQQIGNRAEV